MRLTYIDPQVLPVLEMLGQHDYSKITVEEGRAMYRQAAAFALPVRPNCRVEEFVLPRRDGTPIPCKAIFPPDAGKSLPVVISYMGGTFVGTTLEFIGGYESHIAEFAGSIVVVPLHRVPPEHRYPAAYDDCYDVYAWMTRNAGQIGGDPARIALHGESAGATLAASVCIEARDRGEAQPLMQVLAEPLLDHEAETPSLNELSIMLSRATLRLGSSYYFGDERPARRASPLRVDDLSGLAPAYIVTAALDPLRDEGYAYAVRLRQAGVPVIHTCYEGQIHGFLSMIGSVDQARIAFHQACGVLRLAFAGGLRQPI